MELRCSLLGVWEASVVSWAESAGRVWRQEGPAAGVAAGGAAHHSCGATFPPRDTANCVWLWGELQGKLCSPAAPAACWLRGGKRRSQHVLRVTLKVLMINLIHAQMRFFFFFLKHIALVLK